jgi:branched-chain amino acid aminotransferase
MAEIHLNGRLVDSATARIDPSDRGLLLADGLFETLRSYDGQPFRLDAHLARLAAGAAALDLPMPRATDIAAAVSETIAANGDRQASIRITLTRGPGERGLLPPSRPSPTILIATYPLRDAPSALRANVASMRRNEHSPLSQLKSLAYLDNILALREAASAGCEEALLLNTAGRLTGGSRSNLFLVLDGCIVTPPTSEGLLAGIARQTLLELANAARIPAREAPLSLADIERASEAFLSNSLMEIKPLILLGTKQLEPGRVAADLARRYVQLTRFKSV